MCRKDLYRSSSRQWTAIKNLQWNYLTRTNSYSVANELQAVGISYKSLEWLHSYVLARLQSMHLRYQFSIIILGVCSSNLLATRWGTRNLIYILIFILLWLLLTILILIFLLFFSTQSLLSSSSPNNSISNGFYSQSWTCLGWNKNKVNSVWAMFGYYWTYMVAIGKKLQTNDKLIRWLTNPNRNFNETNEPMSALTSQTLPMTN